MGHRRGKWGETSAPRASPPGSPVTVYRDKKRDVEPSSNSIFSSASSVTSYPGAVTKMVDDIAEREAKLNAHAAAINEREAKLNEREAKVHGMETWVVCRENALLTREADIEKKEADVEKKMSAKQKLWIGDINEVENKQVTQRIAYLGAVESKSKDREKELVVWKQQLVRSQVTMVAERTALDFDKLQYMQQVQYVNGFAPALRKYELQQVKLYTLYKLVHEMLHSGMMQEEAGAKVNSMVRPRLPLAHELPRAQSFWEVLRLSLISRKMSMWS